MKQNIESNPVMGVEDETKSKLESSEPEVKPKQNNLIKILTLVLGGIILLIIVYFAILAYMRFYVKKHNLFGDRVITNTPSSTVQATENKVEENQVDEMAGWKTYIDDKYKYSINYPQNFIFYSKKDNDPSISIGNQNGSISISITYPTGSLNGNAPEKLIPISNLKFTIAGKEYVPEENEAFYFPSEKKYRFRIYPLKDGSAWGSEIDTFCFYVEYIEPDDVKIIDQILSTFKFTEASANTVTPVQDTQTNGVKLAEIKYSLPQNWVANLNNDNLLLSPSAGGGYLSIKVLSYSENTGRREYYCQVSKLCIEGTSRFTQIKIGNISGYKAEALDNSGGGAEYFGAKGDKFYIISSYNPSSPNEFESSYQNVLDSLVF